MTSLKGVDFAAKNQALLRIAKSKRLPTALSYKGILKIIDIRRVDLKMTMLELDERSGLPHGYCAKLFCGTRNLGPLSIKLILGALGAEMAIVPSRPGRGKRFGFNKIRNGALDNHRVKSAGALGGHAKQAKMTPEQWKEFSRKGGFARAAKYKLKKEIAAKKTIRKRANGPRQPPNPRATS